MEILDTPAQLKYNNGNNFPPNFIIIAYVSLAVSVVLIATGTYIIGLAIALLSLFPITNRHIVIIHPEDNYIHDYVKYLGFIKIGKKYPLNKYKYITAMPLIESQQMFANHYNSTTITNSYFTVTFFGERLRGKRIISKFDSRADARVVAIGLCDRLMLKYFDYDPQLVREILRGQREI